MLDLSLANRLSELPRAAEAIDAFLRREGLSPETIRGVQLAVEELLANVVRWSGGSNGERKIRVRIYVEPLQVRAMIEDDGPAFDPLCVPPPDLLTPLEDRREGGLGIHLVRAFVDEVSYRRVGGQNVVEVTVASDRPTCH